MFSIGHLVFILMSLAVIGAAAGFLIRKKPPFRKVLLVCFILGLVSEVVKILSVIEIVPVVEPIVENGVLIYKETGAFTPYLEAEHLPFELCSFQIVFMFLALILRNDTYRKPLYALMYTTCIIGGFMAIFLSSAAPGLVTIRDFITNAGVWRAFLYHIMLVILGIYIGVSEECDVRFRDMKYTFAILVVLDFLSLYVNSIMSTPYYRGDVLMGVGNAVNYFSSYNNPLGIVMSAKAHWLIYLLIRLGAALAVIVLVNLPLLKKEKRSKITHA